MKGGGGWLDKELGACRGLHQNYSRRTTLALMDCGKLLEWKERGI